MIYFFFSFIIILPYKLNIYIQLKKSWGKGPPLKIYYLIDN